MEDDGSLTLKTSGNISISDQLSTTQFCQDTSEAELRYGINTDCQKQVVINNFLVPDHASSLTLAVNIFFVVGISFLVFGI